MEDKNQLKILAGALVVLLVALAATFGIRKFWPLPPEPVPQAEFRESEPAASDAAEDVEPAQITSQDEELLMWLDQELAAAEEPEAMVEEEYVFQEEPEVAAVTEEAAPPQPQRPMAQQSGAWRSVWADLNLTEEEQARLREGWALAVGRWQSMSEDERQALGERMRASWERWQNMSDEEREEASRELRWRFEDWRESGSSELPDMILD